jgi:hypothetical protein
MSMTDETLAHDLAPDSHGQSHAAAMYCHP